MRALLVVEDTFLTLHVGVRRVIFHYWRELTLAGWSVALASPDGRGGLVAREPPRWGPAVTEAIVMGSASTDSCGQSHLLRMTQRAVFPQDFALVVASAPWVLASVPRLRPHVGIVYDIIPNLLSVGAVRLPRFVESGPFAELHDRGIRLMAASGAKISCISRTTRDDVLEAYGAVIPEDEVVVDVPFDIDRVSAGPRAARDSGVLRAVLVNALDVRKGPDVAVCALERVAREVPVSLTVVGAPRMDGGEADSFLARLRGLAADFVRVESPSDTALAAAYGQSDVLVFPSYYEGLGLPVLEAQACGTPVVTCSARGGGEFNMNPELALESFAPDEVADAVIRAGAGPDVLRGPMLRGALADRLVTARHPLWTSLAPGGLAG